MKNENHGAQLNLWASGNNNMGKQEQSEEYDQDVRDIIDSLKSKGLFDQFRKEFVADVDTKVWQILFFHYFILANHTLLVICLL